MCCQAESTIIEDCASKVWELAEGAQVGERATWKGPGERGPGRSGAVGLAGQALQKTIWAEAEGRERRACPGKSSPRETLSSPERPGWGRKSRS